MLKKLSTKLTEYNFSFHSHIINLMNLRTVCVVVVAWFSHVPLHRAEWFLILIGNFEISGTSNII